MPYNYKKLQKERIVRFLGSVGQMKAQKLARYADVNETTDTCANTRALVKELIDEGHLIGSNRDGYKMMTTAKEVQVYLNSLLQRQMGMSKRVLAVYNAAKIKGIL